uniref:NADH-ubiquinone oxidoreductase chain 1 n=1 Tax=Rhizaria sp. TaxID=2204297 RepID=A0A5P8DJV0_9EUKA|nr:NADH dehydrogenase subunit 1 [Rhizaria sp.]
MDYIIHSVLTLIPLLIVVAFFTLAERKAMASIQRRVGPYVVGLWGMLQPFADGLKLVIKEIIIPTKTNKFLFCFAPFLTLFLSFLGWLAIPFEIYTRIFDLNNSLLYILVISSLGVYGIILSGWSSNSKYALMGTLRSVSQMISYEVSISLIIIPIILFSNSFNLNTIIYSQQETIWFIFPLLPISIIFFISILAETNRAPFDLPEAEAELVAGYNVEYSAIMFAMFFLGEYANILLMSSLFVIFFLGGGQFFIMKSFDILYFSLVMNSLVWVIVFAIKTIIITFLFIFVRANLPRFRFDQLMYIGWKIFLPITFSFVLFFSGILFSCKGLGINQMPRISSSFNFIDSFSLRF